ncbi:hypothetical protein VRK_35210 [Vibrio sp. MEBiC08052]|nr:hypothetical protein VRK_35210 [Vibrio sp. MEBiC08052]
MTNALLCKRFHCVVLITETEIAELLDSHFIRGGWLAVFTPSG